MAKSQIGALMGVLRELLRAHGIRYREIAEKLNVTERTVTRWFASERVDTGVIEDLCDLAGIGFFELCELAGRHVEPRASVLTLQQEQALTEHPLLTYLFSHICQGWNADELRRDVNIPEGVFIDGLIKLEKIGLIKLLPGNEIRLLTTREVERRPHGPLTRYQNRWLAWALENIDINEPGSAWAFEALKLSPASIAQLELKFRELIEEVIEMSDADRRLNGGARDWCAVILAGLPIDMRPYSEWTPSYSQPRRAPRLRAVVNR